MHTTTQPVVSHGLPTHICYRDILLNAQFRRYFATRSFVFQVYSSIEASNPQRNMAAICAIALMLSRSSTTCDNFDYTRSTQSLEQKWNEAKDGSALMLHRKETDLVEVVWCSGSDFQKRYAEQVARQRILLPSNGTTSA